MSDIPIHRVPVSLPCSAPVLPGSPEVDAPIADRTEVCAVDGFWMVGHAILCDHHMRAMGMGDVCDNAPALYDGMPWAERHRYPQDEARRLLFPGHPLYVRR